MTDRAEWRSRILANLGADILDVELGETQLDVALRKALQAYEKHQPIAEWLHAVVASATQSLVIDFTVDDKKAFRNVMKVEWYDRNRAFATNPQLLPFVQNTGGTVQLYGSCATRFPRLYMEVNYSNYRQEMMVGLQPDWWWDKEDRLLYLWNPGMNRNASILVVKTMTLEDIRMDQEMDFEKLATAHAKYILARVMKSLGDIPGAGGPIESDGNELRQEAKEEEEKVMADLRRSQRSVPPPMYIG